MHDDLIARGHPSTTICQIGLAMIVFTFPPWVISAGHVSLLYLMYRLNGISVGLVNNAGMSSDYTTTK